MNDYDFYGLNFCGMHAIRENSKIMSVEKFVRVQYSTSIILHIINYAEIFNGINFTVLATYQLQKHFNTCEA